MEILTVYRFVKKIISVDCKVFLKTITKLEVNNVHKIHHSLNKGWLTLSPSVDLWILPLTH